MHEDDADISICATWQVIPYDSNDDDDDDDESDGATWPFIGDGDHGDGDGGDDGWQIPGDMMMMVMMVMLVMMVMIVMMVMTQPLLFVQLGRVIPFFPAYL